VKGPARQYRTPSAPVVKLERVSMRAKPWKVPGAEPWLQPVASPLSPFSRAKTVARGCDRLPRGAHVVAHLDSGGASAVRADRCRTVSGDLRRDGRIWLRLVAMELAGLEPTSVGSKRNRARADVACLGSARESAVRADRRRTAVPGKEEVDQATRERLIFDPLQRCLCRQPSDYI
jgi:hypothetical protein